MSGSKSFIMLTLGDPFSFASAGLDWFGSFAWCFCRRVKRCPKM